MERAGDILSLLGIRHSRDVFIPECKDGGTWNGTHRRLDAWAMPCSWSQWTTYGYEIKVSRSDFLKDNKWRGYLDLCHNFYFVCPWGMIDPSELPNEAGLLYATKNFSRLYTKKKAPPRDVQIPESLYAYILMSRVRIIPRGHEDNPDYTTRDNAAYWKNWLEQKDQNQELGYRVSRRVAKIVGDAQSAVRLAEGKVTFYDGFKETLRQLGFDPDSVGSFDLERRARQRLELVPRDLKWNLDRLSEELAKFKERIDQIETTAAIDGSGDE